jgi:L-aspartate oxidase
MEAIVCAQWVGASVQGAGRGPLKSRAATALPPASDPSAVRPMLSQGLGVLRDRHGIERTIRGLYPLASGHSVASDPALVGLMIAVAAWRREESRGGHFRSDFPHALPSAVPSTITLAEALDAARDIVETESLSVGSAQP